MQVTPDLLSRARKLRTDAVTEIIELYYSRVHRMAFGLCPRESDAKTVIRTVMKQSLRQIPKWRHEDSPQRWFNHHTVLATRRLARDPSNPRNDTLVLASAADAEYLAFISALRKLPFQQREAYVLRFGEGFDARQMGAAMDLSTEAAQQHLKVAESQLTAVAGEKYSTFLSTMASAYQRYAPPPKVVLSNVSDYVTAYKFQRRVIFILRVLAIATIVLGGAALAWWISNNVVI